MPCGGIVDVLAERPEAEREWHDNCCHCNQYLDKDGAWPNLYVEEWDGFMVHKSCLVAWLQTEEGEILIHHNHAIYFECTEWIKEGQPWPDNWKTILENACAKT